jgi:gamma-glutamyltranspeptidase
MRVLATGYRFLQRCLAMAQAVSSDAPVEGKLRTPTEGGRGDDISQLIVALVRSQGAWLGGADPRREGIVAGD